MFVRLLFSLLLVATALAQSNDHGVFSAGQAAKEGAPGILPEMLKVFTGESSDRPKFSAAELQTIMRRNAAVISDIPPIDEYSAGHIPGPVPRPVSVAPPSNRPPDRNLPLPDSASQ